MKKSPRVALLSSVVSTVMLAMVPAAFAVLPAPVGVVTNKINGPHEGGVHQGNSNLGPLLSIATNGIISTNTPADDFQDQWDTYWDGPGALTDFAGLVYGAPATFDSVTAHTFTLGFVDGGTWETTPKVYILRAPYNTAETRPEFHPYWEEVAGVTTAVFNPISTTGGQAVTFDLTALSISDRTGYGWAIGGVDGTQNAGGCCNFITVTELEAVGDAATPDLVPRLMLGNTPTPINVVANQYNSAHLAGIGHGPSRGTAFEAATNGNIAGTPFSDQFDTYPLDGESQDLSEFAGLIYATQVEFESVTAHTITTQFVDGGEWQSEPKLYMLINPVDTNQTRPEDDPANWVEVTGAVFSSTHVPQTLSVERSNAFTFDLSGLHPAQRTGYGWAIGGVDGTENPAGDWNFVTITELTAAGTVVPEPHTLLVVTTLLTAVGLARAAGWRRSNGRA